MQIHKVTWLFDVCRLGFQHSGKEKRILYSIATGDGVKGKLFSGLKSFWGRPCALESDVKLMAELAEWLTFPSQSPLRLWSFLEHVMANLVRIHIQSFPSEETHPFTPLIYTVYLYMYKQTMNNVQLINALHKLLFAFFIMFWDLWWNKKKRFSFQIIDRQFCPSVALPKAWHGVWEYWVNL